MFLFVHKSTLMWYTQLALMWSSHLQGQGGLLPAGSRDRRAREEASDGGGAKREEDCSRGCGSAALPSCYRHRTGTPCSYTHAPCLSSSPSVCFLLLLFFPFFFVSTLYFSTSLLFLSFPPPHTPFSSSLSSFFSTSSFPPPLSFLSHSTPSPPSSLLSLYSSASPLPLSFPASSPFSPSFGIIKIDY